MQRVEAAVADYIERYRPRAARELRYFQVLRSDEEAVSQAARARLPRGGKHDHQRRIPPATLEESARRLLANLPRLRNCETFEELHDLIDALIRPIPKIGELAVYDTALRIGVRFELEPEKVYIHAGTRDGARALGLEGRRRTIEMDELPEPVRKLTAREAEDLLCIYKSKLRP